MDNRLTIEIYGTRYSITTTEDPQYVKTLAGEIDTTLFELMRSGRTSLNQALLLLCLQYLDSEKKSEQGADHLRSQVAEYLEDASKARTELAEAQLKIDRLERAKK